jgi:hypothetical protein
MADTDLADWKLAPTEELILEVLIARHRLGHSLWTFTGNSTVIRYLDKLARKGFIIYQHGITQNTFRAELSPEGRKYLMSNDYTPPIQGGPQ